MKYVGPIDGHDVAAMEAALRRAKSFGGPVIVHAVTVKGFGYQPAVDDEADCLHSVAPVTDPLTGKPMNASARGWTSVFGEEMVAIGGERQDVVAITAAMLQPVGLLRFSEAYPTARSTSASPSSTPSPRPRGWRWAACTRSSACTPPSSTGPSTRR